MRAPARGFLFASPLLALLLAPSLAEAQPPPPDLMARLAAQSSAFDQLKLRASFAFEGRMERLDGDGNADSVKQIQARVVANGKEAHVVVVKYVEDGEDKTEERRKKQHEDEAKKDKDDDHEIHNPFLAAEQARYVFDEVEADKRDPDRVRISFVPKAPDGHTVEGSAWVDAKTGRFLSAGFKVSEPGMFVDYVRVTLELGADTALGPAVSKLTLEGKGGILFFRKRFRAWATFTDYRIAP